MKQDDLHEIINLYQSNLTNLQLYHEKIYQNTYKINQNINSIKNNLNNTTAQLYIANKSLNDINKTINIINNLKNKKYRNMLHKN